jgi:hypothetical protein
MTPSFPKTLYVKDSSIEEYDEESWEQIENDPRGILLMWEPPQPRARYIMGLDPTEGLTGWSRATRVPGDEKTDNAAIEIFRVDGARELMWKFKDGKKIPVIDEMTGKQAILYRDVQVAEFAAPCDAVEIAKVANVLGRIYAGKADDQCELIWEAYPGPGILSTQELIRLGYGNLWMWEYITNVAEETNSMGWRANRESMKLLWFRSRRHLMKRKAIIKSQFLLAEYANAEIDVDKMRAKAAYGYHDDRLCAANMCFWAGHKWTYDVERTDEPVTTSPVLDYQNYAPTLGDEMTFQSWKERATDDWLD